MKALFIVDDYKSKTASMLRIEHKFGVKLEGLLRYLYLERDNISK
jgi:hypothetical protein